MEKNIMLRQTMSVYVKCGVRSCMVKWLLSLVCVITCMSNGSISANNEPVCQMVL